MNQWQHYKELELIPDSAPAPKVSKFNIGAISCHLAIAAECLGTRASVRATHGVSRAVLGTELF